MRPNVPTAVLLATLLLPTPAVTQGGGPAHIGDKIESFRSLRDVRGNRRDLRDFDDYRAFVLVFVTTECPLANLYVPRLIQLHDHYLPEGVKFVAVYPNEDETLGEIATHAMERDLPFLTVKDTRQRLADKLGIERTPTAVLLDADMVLRYRGRIDDQYAVASRRPAPEHEDLVDALDALLAGEAIARSETSADGCLIERESGLPPRKDVTFARDVAPILQRRCESCHRPGQIGPFPLQTYRDAARRRNMIREVVAQRRMPPWQADPRFGHFANDRSMTEDEIATIVAWVDAGAPEGDRDDMPPPRDWTNAFDIEKPDLVFQLPETMEIPAEGVLDYVYITSDPGLEEDVWVTAAQIVPGDARVVHHAIVSVVPPGSADGSSQRPRFGGKTLVNWVPGAQAKRNPPGTALRIPAGYHLLWNLHYTTNGVATTDRTSVVLEIAKEPPVREAHYNSLVNARIRIPANTEHHTETHRYRFRADARLLSLRPHMHYRGKSWRYELEYPDGRTETILSVPNWDFNWQTEYAFEEPLRIPEGTVIVSTATWDNSDNNLLNPDRSKALRWGWQSWDEMMNGWMKYVWEGDPPPRTSFASFFRNRGQRQDPAAYARMVFGYLDKDRNGKLDAEEWAKSTRTKPMFERRGIELDLPIDLDGFLAAYPNAQK